MEYYGSNDYRDYLMHAGRVGMKWYVRNHQDYITKPTRSGKIGKYYGQRVDHDADQIAKSQESEKERIEREKKGVKYRRKDLKTMSDEELDARLERLRKEKEYKQLTNETRSEAIKIAQDILKETGKKAAVNVGSKVAEYAVKQAVAKVAGKEIADEMFGSVKLKNAAQEKAEKAVDTVKKATDVKKSVEREQEWESVKNYDTPEKQEVAALTRTIKDYKENQKGFSKDDPVYKMYDKEIKDAEKRLKAAEKKAYKK